MQGLPKHGAVMVSVVAPTEYPVDLVTGVLPTCAEAVRVAAPEAVMLAGFNVIAATPEALVIAVPLVGVIVAKVASVVKVTTAFGTG